MSMPHMEADIMGFRRPRFGIGGLCVGEFRDGSWGWRLEGFGKV